MPGFYRQSGQWRNLSDIDTQNTKNFAQFLILWIINIGSLKSGNRILGCDNNLSGVREKQNCLVFVPKTSGMELAEVRYSRGQTSSAVLRV